MSNQISLCKNIIVPLTSQIGLKMLLCNNFHITLDGSEEDKGAMVVAGTSNHENTGDKSKPSTTPCHITHEFAIEDLCMTLYK